VPVAVVMVTVTEDDGPAMVGTVTVQVDWSGQLVGATWPPKEATICPLALRKLAPVIVTIWPDPPAAGLSDERRGAPPVTAGVLVPGRGVVVVREPGALCPGVVADARCLPAPVAARLTAPWWAPREKARAMAEPTTRPESTTIETMSR